MAETKGVRFTVSLLVAANAETGEEFILYTDREFDEQKALEWANVEEGLTAQLMGGEPEKKIEAARAMCKGGIDARYERLRRERDEAMPVAERMEFTLIKPVYKEHSRVRSLATEYNEESGASHFDPHKYIDELLPHYIEGMKAEDVRDLSPTVFDELGARLMRSIMPNRSRMPFTSSPLKPS